MARTKARRQHAGTRSVVPRKDPPMMTLHLLPTQRCRQGHRASPLAIAAVLLGLLRPLVLGGCGAGASPSPASAPPASPPPGPPLAPTPLPPLAPTPLPTVDPTQLPPACRDLAPAGRVGGLFAGAQARLGNLSYPRVHLPASTPLKPLQVPSVNPQLPSDAPTNPELGPLGGGYVVALCNGSAQTHRIDSVAVRLDRVTPYAGQLNEWVFCAAPYTRSLPTGGGGAGGGPGQDEYVQGAFAPDALPGTVAETTQTPGIPSDRYGKLPWALPPGETILIDVRIVPPTAPGDYTFAFGRAIDGATPVFAAVTPATLLAPVAHEWTGDACLAPEMQSQIPLATKPPTLYLCPPSSLARP